MEGNTQERPQREPVLAIPGDGPVGGETLQVADKQHPEVDTRRDRGPSLAGKAWGAEFFSPGVGSIFGEKVVEPGVKGMPLALGKLMLIDPHLLLLGFTSTNRHAVITPCCEMVNSDYRTWDLGNRFYVVAEFFNGLLEQLLSGKLATNTLVIALPLQFPVFRANRSFQPTGISQAFCEMQSGKNSDQGFELVAGRLVNISWRLKLRLASIKRPLSLSSLYI